MLLGGLVTAMTNEYMAEMTLGIFRSVPSEVGSPLLFVLERPQGVLNLGAGWVLVSLGIALIKILWH